MTDLKRAVGEPSMEGNGTDTGAESRFGQMVSKRMEQRLLTYIVLALLPKSIVQRRGLEHIRELMKLGGPYPAYVRETSRRPLLYISPAFRKT